MNPRYSLQIAWFEEDQAFLARVPELLGSMADGETYGAAVVCGADHHRGID